MSWHYKPPQAWPAIYLRAVREATLDPGSAIILWSSPARSDIDAMAEKFRHFRWCVRKEPLAMKEMTDLLEIYDIRAKIKSDELGHILYIIANPTKLSEFARLNPKLANEMLSKCQ